MSLSRPVLVLAVMVLLSLHGVWAAEPKPAEDYGLAVGKKMPTHVVDFVNDKREHRCGCPSIMIANSGGRGLIIWTRGVSDAAFQLAKAVGAGDGDKFQRFLIAFDADEKPLREKAAGVGGVLVGQARDSAREQFDRSGIDAKVLVLVFLLDKNEVKARWLFAADELTDDKIKVVVAGAKEFAAGGK